MHFYIQKLLNILLNCSSYTFSKQSPSFFTSDIDYHDARFCIRINSASACVLNAFKGTFRHVATGTIMFHNEANVHYPTNNWFVVLGESRRAWSAPSKGSTTHVALSKKRSYEFAGLNCGIKSPKLLIIFVSNNIARLEHVVLSIDFCLSCTDSVIFSLHLYW